MHPLSSPLCYLLFLGLVMKYNVMQCVRVCVHALIRARCLLLWSWARPVSLWHHLYATCWSYITRGLIIGVNTHTHTHGLYVIERKTDRAEQINVTVFFCSHTTYHCCAGDIIPSTDWPTPSTLLFIRDKVFPFPKWGSCCLNFDVFMSFKSWKQGRYKEDVLCFIPQRVYATCWYLLLSCLSILRGDSHEYSHWRRHKVYTGQGRLLQSGHL